MRLGSHWMTVPNKCQSIIVIWKDANTNHTHHCDVQCNELSWYDCNATLLGNVRILAVTMKLITIERFFFQQVFTKFPHRNLMFCTNPT
jgi:hypothetical protein